MNIIRLNNGFIEFSGFSGIENDSEITVRIISDKLVFNRDAISTEHGTIKVQITDRKSNDPNLIDFFKYYCNGKATSFISSKADESEYIQHLPIE